jgi:hypothetical protein
MLGQWFTAPLQSHIVNRLADAPIPNDDSLCLKIFDLNILQHTQVSSINSYYSYKVLWSSGMILA